ncbi:MAG: lipoate--protein ligase family protein [Hyphomicrobiaceae bacterium]|nr:lipoate--protein ligase family protein [Hyphomicrobiaceae bacterium]
MSLAFRVIDTGLREGRANIAFDAALVELHGEGAIPDTMRFLRFQPTALVGRHQAISRELKLDRCREAGVGTGRRITGGGAIYFSPGMLGWELVLSRRRLPMPSLADYARRICESAAGGLSRAFGIDARYRPRNDIEVAGRKLCGTGGFFDGDTLFYQGTVLIDVAPEEVMSVLNVPRAKLDKHALDRPESRITTLRELHGNTPDDTTVQKALAEGLAQGLGLSLEWSTPTPLEEARADKLYRDEIGSDDFVFEIDAPTGDDVRRGEAQCAGGTVVAFLRVEGPASTPRIRDVLITGDFLVTPPRLVLDLEAHLRGVPVSDASAAVDAFFATARPEMLSIVAADFRTAIERALAGL